MALALICCEEGHQPLTCPHISATNSTTGQNPPLDAFAPWASPETHVRQGQSHQAIKNGKNRNMTGLTVGTWAWRTTELCGRGGGRHTVSSSATDPCSVALACQLSALSLPERRLFSLSCSSVSCLHSADEECNNVQEKRKGTPSGTSASDGRRRRRRVAVPRRRRLVTSMDLRSLASLPRGWHAGFKASCFQLGARTLALASRRRRRRRQVLVLRWHC